MKIRAKANGNIVDVSDGEAEALLAAGIYEPVDGPTKAKSKASEPKAPPAAAPKPAPAEQGASKVEPLTTKDLPAPPVTPKSLIKKAT